MEQSEPKRSALIVTLPYLGAVLLVIVGLLLEPQQTSARKFLSAGNPLLLGLLLLFPIACGLGVTWISRRFWTWPYAFLLALLVVVGGLLSTVERGAVDAAFAYARVLTICITVLVAELVGLTIGRLVHRVAGLAFFLGAALWLGAQAINMTFSLPSFWGSAVAWCGTLGFLAQALLQLARHLRNLKAERDGVLLFDEEVEDDELEDEPPVFRPPPRPTVNENALAWKVIIADLPGNSATPNAPPAVPQGPRDVLAPRQSITPLADGDC